MMSRRAIVLIILLLAYISMATASNVLFVTSPRLPSHIFGMRKMAEEIASRQHNVLVKPLYLYHPCTPEPGSRGRWPMPEKKPLRE